MTYKLAALIPTHNHYKHINAVINDFTQNHIPVFIIDDGSNEETKAVLQDLVTKNSLLTLITHTKNQGKGIAVHTGLNALREQGYTHAFQIDADGQHARDTILDFIKLSQDNEHALCSGEPIYNICIPRSRRIGRWFTHVWVWIETLSLRISDSMCGYRIYPIAETLSILNQRSIGARMDFDTEIMVRLFWQGIPTLMMPVRITYPEGNTSNFRMFRDNVRITVMHTRLVIALILNLFAGKIKHPNYKTLKLNQKSLAWSSIDERGHYFGIWLLFKSYQTLGKNLSTLIATPIVFYYFLTGTEQRKSSQTFLAKIYKLGNLSAKPTLGNCFHHFMCFFEATLDKFSGWMEISSTNDIEPENFQKLIDLVTPNKGGMMLTSHIGNMEFCRALAEHTQKKRIHILMHTKNAQKFFKVLSSFNPNVDINLIEVTEVGPDTIMFLSDQIYQGNWVVISGDRIPVTGHERHVHIPFLGDIAPFAQGPYILAHLLKCPVFMVAAVRVKNKYRIIIEKLSDGITLSHNNKTKDIEIIAKRYVTFLEDLCMHYPYQWFNFFNFWANP